MIATAVKTRQRSTPIIDTMLRAAEEQERKRLVAMSDDEFARSVLRSSILDLWNDRVVPVADLLAQVMRGSVSAKRLLAGVGVRYQPETDTLLLEDADSGRSVTVNEVNRVVGELSKQEPALREN